PSSFLFSTATATTELYTLSLHDALPIFINADQQHSLDVALAQLPVLQRMLAAMPLAIFNPELSQDLIWHPDTENEAEAILLNWGDRKSTRLNSSHVKISYAVFCLKKKRK